VENGGSGQKRTNYAPEASKLEELPRPQFRMARRAVMSTENEGDWLDGNRCCDRGERRSRRNTGHFGSSVSRAGGWSGKAREAARAARAQCLEEYEFSIRIHGR
jgi:hypothetical protein